MRSHSIGGRRSVRDLWTSEVVPVWANRRLSLLCRSSEGIPKRWGIGSEAGPSRGRVRPGRGRGGEIVSICPPGGGESEANPHLIGRHERPGGQRGGEI